MDAELLSHASRREVRSRHRGAGPELRSPSTGWAQPPPSALTPPGPPRVLREELGQTSPFSPRVLHSTVPRTAPHVILSVPQAGGATSGAYRRSYRGGLARCLRGPAARTRRLGRLSHDGGGKGRPSGGCTAPERPHSRRGHERGPTDTPCPGPAPREPRERRARRPHGAAHRYGNGRKARRAERKRREKTLRDSAFPANERAERRRG